VRDRFESLDANYKQEIFILIINKNYTGCPENQYLEKYSQAKKEEKKLYKHRSENRKSFPNYNHFYVKKLKFTSRSIDLDFPDTLYNKNTSMEKSEKSSNCIFR